MEKINVQGPSETEEDQETVRRRIPLFKRRIKCGYCGHIEARYREQVQKANQMYRLYVCGVCNHWTMISVQALYSYGSHVDRSQTTMDRYRYV